MTNAAARFIRILLVGAPGSEFHIAAGMARDAGAEAAMADTIDAALAHLRDLGSDMVMVDVAIDVAEFISRLRAERIAVPVLACGIDAPAERAVAAIRAGARDYVPLPPDRDLIAAAIMSVAQRPARMIGEDRAFNRVVSLAMSVARSSAPVLISGEHGSGKQVLARAIHDASGRQGRFLAVECAGIAPEAIGSELFGHEAGAFSGAASRRLGRIEEAAGGTIFLSDVNALPPATQAKLLAIIQGDGFYRLGGSQPLPSSTRIIAGTSVDLDACTLRGAFRADLLAEFDFARIPLPPLRQRPSDVGPLARHFAERFALADGRPLRPISDEALAHLEQYHWPNNVRELENVIHRSVLLATGAMIEPEDIMLIDGTHLMPMRRPAEARVEIDGLVGRTVEEVERELILQTLEHCRGNRTSASSILGISVRTMRNKLRSFIEAGIPVSPAH